MNALRLAEQLRESFVRYLTTTFDIGKQAAEEPLAAALRRSLRAPGALFQGPYLELTPPYRTGVSLRALAADGVLSDNFTALPCFDRGLPLPADQPLYLHQETAIRRIITGQRNIVVASGTGSGKTECFLVPILDDLRRDRSPGVRALLIYPMNALVNDQLDRLRSLLADTEITFGRYTSELAETEDDARKRWALDEPPLCNEVISREAIRGNPAKGIAPKVPQILITNYAMLEYLLLRPQDSTIFESGAWRFIVLDEAHTYSGAQGIEVALLIRRLKHRLNKEQGQIRCIATSATLTRDDREAAASFAASLFGEEFNASDVIFGESNYQFTPTVPGENTPSPEAYLAIKDSLIERLRVGEIDQVELAIELCDAGILDTQVADWADGHSGGDVGAFLWHSLAGNEHLRRLRTWMQGRPPAMLSEAGREIFPELPIEDAELAAYRLVELGTLARPSPDSTPIVPARYHLFARPPQGAWVCLNEKCPGRESPPGCKWSRLFTVKRETCDACGSVVYGLSVCRSCGQPYVVGYRKATALSPDPSFPGSSEGREYYTWAALSQEQSLGEESDDDGEADAPLPGQEEMRLCLHCRREASQCTCEAVHQKLTTLHRLVEPLKEAGGGRAARLGRRNAEVAPVAELKRCRRCGTQRRREGVEIATSVTVGGSVPLAVLTEELYRSLPQSSIPSQARKPGQGRKLLTFSDSRQGAARYAAYLQDTVNGNLYRHLIVEATRELNAQGRIPDVESLSDKSVDFCDQYGIYVTDLEFANGGVSHPGQRVSQEERRRRLREATARILAEFCTRPLRHSLSTIGLVSCDYFDAPIEIPGLPELLGVDQSGTRAALSALLDTLRHEKAISLPDGIKPDHPAFGFQQGVVRCRLSEARSLHSEINWIGEKPTQSRYDYARRVLQAAGRPSSDFDVRNALSIAWEVLRSREQNLLVGNPAQGYQVDWRALVFDACASWYRCDRCLRLTTRASEHLRICPSRGCTGNLIPCEPDVDMADDHYRYIFSRRPVGMRIEEHTAQLESGKGREYQDAFKAGDINLLSCSTTFELGVDLGELHAVVLNNVPPTVANYRQRAGRAGRRAGGAAFILTFAAERPHDQVFFSNPPAIIAGEVRIPHLALENQLIARRHLNAILLGSLLRYLASQGISSLSKVGPFFDPQAPGGCHADLIPRWLEEARADIRNALMTFKPYYDIEEDPDKTVTHFVDLLQQHQEYVVNTLFEYQQELESWAKEATSPYSTNREQAMVFMNRFSALAERMRDERLIDELSSASILPSYSFPIYVVKLRLPWFDGRSRELRLERDLRQAIVEYAPGADVVADKRIWHSGGLEIRKSPKFWSYRICERCHHVAKRDAPGLQLLSAECPVCGEFAGKRAYAGFKYIRPDGFQTDWGKSGKPAGQHAARPENRSRAALWSRGEGPEETWRDAIHYAYRRNGELLAVNGGPYPDGFRICWTCGAHVPGRRTGHHTPFGKSCSNPQIESAHLGHSFHTDTLHLRFAAGPNLRVPPPDDMSFWLSLMYALLQGASQSLQIERRDLDGVLAPYRSENDDGWQQEVVLFDNVPGGAGHVKRVAESLGEVLGQALLVANCPDCAPETSCYHCLRDYNNQVYHDQLKRGPVAQFVEGLTAIVNPSLHGYQVSGNVRVIAANRGRWLAQQISSAKTSVWAVLDAVESGTPRGEYRGWLDLLQDLLMKGKEVHLWVHSLPDAASTDGLGLRRHLRVLCDEYGLDLQLVQEVPAWNVLIDPESLDHCRAIRIDEHASLGPETGEQEMITTSRADEVQAARQLLQKVQRMTVAAVDLDAPRGVVVRHVVEGEQVSIPALLGKCFERPLEEISVNDRYLQGPIQLACLMDYLRLVRGNGKPVRVKVRTLRASVLDGLQADDEAQLRAFKRLTQEFPNLQLEWDIRSSRGQIDHDRYLILHRGNGNFARITIGAGLDFLRGGRARATTIVIEDPWREGR